MKVIKIRKQALSEDMMTLVKQEFANLDQSIRNVGKNYQEVLQNINNLSPADLYQYLTTYSGNLEQIRLRYAQLAQQIENDEMADDQKAMQQMQNTPDGQGAQVGAQYTSPTNPTGPMAGPVPTGGQA